MEKTEKSDKWIDLNAEADSGVSCSICLDLVTYVRERSRAKLQCGHEFHLDCIGSAFNMKGTMQCPNCRKIEKGRWLYASGSTNSSPELSMDDASIDNYPFYLGFTEMPYRVQVCPFRGLTQVHPSPESSLGIMNSITSVVNHRHPGPHPHGWLQFHHAPYPHHHHQLAPALPLSMPMPQRSLPRFIPPAPGLVYDPSGGFSLASPMSYSRSWVSVNIPHLPLH